MGRGVGDRFGFINSVFFFLVKNMFAEVHIDNDVCGVVCQVAFPWNSDLS